MYKYSIPSPWYVRLHNKSLANKDTITIPVGEEESYIIMRKYIKVVDDDEYTEYAISGPYILLWQVEQYFYGEKTLDNTLETIKMFAWFNCTNAIKKFDISNSEIKLEILLQSFKYNNQELFDYIIQYVSIEDTHLFIEKHESLFRILGRFSKAINLIAIINAFNKKIKFREGYLKDVFTVIDRERKTRNDEMKGIFYYYGV
jgi:hypothetical protein